MRIIIVALIPGLHSSFCHLLYVIASQCCRVDPGNKAKVIAVSKLASHTFSLPKPTVTFHSSCPRNIHINRASKVRRRDPNPTNSHTSSRAASLPSPNTAHTTNPQKTKRLESELSHCKPQRTFPVSAPSAANNSQTTAHCTPFASPTVDDHELSLHVSNLHSMQDHPQNTSTAVFASPTVDDRELSLHVSNLHSMQDHPQNTSTAVSYTLDGNPIT